MLNGLRQQGLSLVELMIGLLLSTIIVLGGINLYLSIVRSGADVYERNRLTDELRSMNAILVKDIRRAGFWEANPVADDVWSNPFTASGTDLVIGEKSGEAASSCVMYSYDLDTNGAVSDPNDPSATQERFGFRLNNQKVEMFAGDSFSCSGGTWETLSSPDVLISNLGFSLAQVCLDVATETVETCPCNTGDACQHIRTVNVSITAQLAQDAAVTETLTEAIKVRNDKFVLSVP